MKVLSGLPYDVLWKWDSDELPAQYKNIKFSKWLPQADLLRKYSFTYMGLIMIIVYG